MKTQFPKSLREFLQAIITSEAKIDSLKAQNAQSAGFQKLREEGYCQSQLSISKFHEFLQRHGLELSEEDQSTLQAYIQLDGLSEQEYGQMFENPLDKNLSQYPKKDNIIQIIRSIVGGCGEIEERRKMMNGDAKQYLQKYRNIDKKCIKEILYDSGLYSRINCKYVEKFIIGKNQDLTWSDVLGQNEEAKETMGDEAIQNQYSIKISEIKGNIERQNEGSISMRKKAKKQHQEHQETLQNEEFDITIFKESQFGKKKHQKGETQSEQINETAQRKIDEFSVTNQSVQIEGKGKIKKSQKAKVDETIDQIDQIEGIIEQKRRQRAERQKIIEQQARQQQETERKLQKMRQEQQARQRESQNNQEQPQDKDKAKINIIKGNTRDLITQMEDHLEHKAQSISSLQRLRKEIGLPGKNVLTLRNIQYARIRNREMEVNRNARRNIGSQLKKIDNYDATMMRASSYKKQVFMENNRMAFANTLSYLDSYGQNRQRPKRDPYRRIDQRMKAIGITSRPIKAGMQYRCRRERMI